LALSPCASRAYATGVSQAEIGRQLGRNSSTISRESGNRPAHGSYQPVTAERLPQRHITYSNLGNVEGLVRSERVEKIGAAGAGFRSLTENIDTTPAGCMMMQMVASFAESSAP
jgi:hypothetical protein